MRGQKGDVYEGGTRVPTLVSWPGRVKPGRVESPVQITDWMPTFCSLTGFKSERNLKWDGTDLTELLTNHTPLPARVIYTAGPRWRASSLRYGDWKLVTNGEGKSRRTELFNIVNDPTESKNLAKTDPQRVQEMLAELVKAVASDNDSVVK